MAEPEQTPTATPQEASEAPRAAENGAKNRPWMLLLLVLAAAALFWPRGGGTAPDGNLLDAMSQEVPLRPAEQRVTLVHFWATWCPPCITEIPSLGRLITDYSQEDEFRVALIAVDDSPEKVHPFLGSLILPVLYDPSWKLAHRYGTRKLPETHLVVDGEVVETYAGATNWDDPEIRQLIDQALRSAPSGR